VRAIKKTDEWAGNYAQMGKWEKTALRDGLGFYGWTRFILPLYVKAMFERPQVLAMFRRAQALMEHEMGANATVFPEGLPPELRFTGITGPESIQGRGRSKLLGTTEFTVGAMEDPANAALQVMLPALGGVGIESDQEAGAAVGPVAKLFWGLILGQDLSNGRDIGRTWSTTQPIKLFRDYERGDLSPSEWSRDYALGQFAFGFVKRPTASAMRIAQMYGEEGQDGKVIDHLLRLKVGQDLAGLDHVLASVLSSLEQASGLDPGDLGSFEAQSIGGFFGPQAPGLPVRWRSVNTADTLGANIRRGQEAAKAVP